MLCLLLSLSCGGLIFLAMIADSSLVLIENSDPDFQTTELFLNNFSHLDFSHRLTLLLNLSHPYCVVKKWYTKPTTYYLSLSILCFASVVSAKTCPLSTSYHHHCLL